MKQKAQLQWFKEGDTNSKYFQSLVRRRRRRIFMHKIIIEDKEWLQGDDNIAKVSYDHFQQIFTGDDKSINGGNLDSIPMMVSQEHDDRLNTVQTMEELKEVVFSMNPTSAAGPD